MQRECSNCRRVFSHKNPKTYPYSLQCPHCGSYMNFKADGAQSMGFRRFELLNASSIKKNEIRKNNASD